MRLLFLVAATVVMAGCKQDSCLGNDPGCRITSPCAALTYQCDAPLLELRVLDGTPGERPGGFRALGGKGDVLIGNDQVVAVLSGLDNQNYVDVGGGALLDFSNRGRDNDALSEIITVVGLLPDDEAHYDTLTLIDERPTRVAVQLDGSLYQHPELTVHTLYEMRPCEPGIRVRSEIWNGSPDTQLWSLSDGAYWSARNVLPFTPGPDTEPGSGFDQPLFDIGTVGSAFHDMPYLAASTHNDTATSYSITACNTAHLNGFQSSGVSSAGLPQQIVIPRSTLVYERFMSVAATPDISGAVNQSMGVRTQLFGERYVTLHGHLTGGATDGRERHAAVELVELRDGIRIPWTEVVPAADGTFAAGVPAGAAMVGELWVLGHKVAATAAPTDGSDLVLNLDSRTRVTVSAVDDDGQPLDAEVYVVPADDATATAAVGTLFGQFDACAPWLGAPYGSSPACNRVLLSRMGPTTFDIPSGSFWIYAYHGPFFSLARAHVDSTQAQPQTITLTLRALPLRPPGTVSADLHVHGASSFDSSIPDEDRVRSFAAADVEVIIATDHDVVGHYAEVVTALGLDDRLSVVDGVETTGHVPTLRVPGDPFPHVIGHYNFWPLRYQPGLPRAGAPFDEFIEPGELFRRIEPLFVGSGPGIRQLNHPWADAEFGRDLGFPRAVSLDLLRPLPVADDGTGQGMYVRDGNGGHDTQEVMNQSNNLQFAAYRAFWFYLLNQGQPKTGTANSDSHSLTDNTVGAPRNVVWTTTVAGPTFDIGAFNTALLAGHVLGTNGPIIEAELVDGGSGDAVQPGMAVLHPSAAAMLHVTVSAAPWVVVDEIRVVVNGQVVQTLPATNPADPFGTDGLVRYDGQIALGPLLPPPPLVDAWIVIEAGARLPLVGDLGGGLGNAKDGVPDTADNNADGVVDQRDVAAGELTGPILPPPSPDRGDPRWHFYQVVPGGYPLAFTNPFLLDRDGNGRFDGVKP